MRGTVGRGRLPNDPADLVRAQLEALGPDRSHAWWREVTTEFGFDTPAEVAIELAKVPALAAEAIEDPARAASLLSVIEATVVDTVATLTGHAARCAS